MKPSEAVTDAYTVWLLLKNVPDNEADVCPATTLPFTYQAYVLLTGSASGSVAIEVRAMVLLV